MGAGYYTSGLRRDRVMTSAPGPPEPPAWAAYAGSGIANMRPVIEPLITIRDRQRPSVASPQMAKRAT